MSRDRSCAWRQFGSHAIRVAVMVAVAIAALGISTARAAILAELSFTPDLISMPQVSTLRLDIANTDPEEAQAATGNFSLPAGLVVAAWPNLSNSCGGAISVTPGGTVVGVVGAAIPAATAGGAGRCAIAIDVTPASTGTFVAQIPAGGLTTTRGNLQQGIQAALQVAAQAPITGTLGFSPGFVHGNPMSEAAQSTVTITLTNPNGAALTGVAFTDTLPAGLLLSRFPPNPSTTCGGSLNNPQPLANSISLTNGTIPAGGSCSLTFPVFIAKDTANNFHDETLSNTIAAGAITTTQGITNASFSGNLRIQTGAQVVKTFNPTSIASGGAPTLQLEFRNFNAVPLTSISLTDNLPNPMRVANPTNAATTCSSGSVNASPGNANFSFTNGQAPAAPAGEGFTSCTARVSVTATTTSEISLTNTTDPNVFGGVNVGPSSATIIVVPANNISAQKTFTGTAVQSGVVTLTIVLRNQAAAPAGNASLTDDLAGTMGPGYAVASSPAPTSTCGGTLNAPPGATAFTLSNGTIPAGGTCAITVPVQISGTAALGTRTNTIPAGGIQTNQGNTITAVTASINTVAALGLSKAFAPTTVVAGQDARLTITIAHTDGAAAFTNLSFTDALPAGHVVSTTPGVANTCGGTVTANPGAGTFSLAAGTLGTGATTCTVQVNVTAPGTSGSSTNTLAAGAITTAQGVTNGSPASATLVRVQTAVSLAKSFTPDAISTGGTSTLRLIISNTDASALALTGASLADLLPPDLVVANPVNATFTGTGCSGTVTAPPGGNLVLLSGASIGVNSQCVLQVQVTTSAVGSLVNQVNPGALHSSQGVTNANAASAMLEATGTADLSVTKLAEATSATPGATVAYVVTVTNAGPDSVAGAIFADQAPTGTTFIAWTCAPSTGAQCTASGSGDLLDTVSIPSGGSLQYFVTAEIDPAATGSVTNTATITPPADVDDPAPGNNTASLTLPLVPSTVIGVFKTDGSEVYTPGGRGTYLVTVTNLGPSDAADVGISDPLPPGVTLTGPATCTAVGDAICGTISGTTGDSAVVATGGRIAAGPLNSLFFLVPVAFASDLATDPLVNTVTATDAASGGSGVSSDSNGRLPVVALAVGVDSGNPTYTPGGTGTVTVTVTNANGVSDALDVTVGNLLPPGVTVAGTITCAANNHATCGAISGAVGGTSFGLSGAVLGAGAGNALVLVVPVAFASSLTTNPLVFTATATDAASGASAVGSDTDNRLPIVALGVGVDSASPTYTPGGTDTVTVTVTNANGLSDALDVTVGNLLPPGVTVAGEITCAANNHATCGEISGAVGGTSFGLSGAVLGAGAGNALVLVVPVAFASNLTTNPLVFTATATDASSGSSATSSDSVTPVVSVALTLSKSDGTDTYRPGSKGAYTIVVGNAGLSEAVSVSLTDTLPAGVTLTAEVTCSAAGNASCGTLNGTPGGSTFGASGARVGAGAGNTLTFVAPVAFAADLLTDPLVNTATVSDLPSGSVATASDSNAREDVLVAVPAISPQALAILVLLLLLSGIAMARRHHRGNA